MTQPVEHVFVLMLENRSLDHMLGFSSLRVTYMRPALGCLLDPVPGQ